MTRDTAMLAILLDAYRSGYFPMADPATGRVGWFSADPRAIIPLDPGAFHVSRSLARRLRSHRFVVTADRAFEAVTRACAEPRPDRPDTWIDARILRAYAVLLRAGHAHSVEAWLPPPLPDGAGRNVGSALRADTSPRSALVGGIYGIAIGGAFIAESMFCRPELGGTDASKVCLAHLVAHLRARGFRLLDVQIANPHTLRFGVVEISRSAFIRRLKSAATLAPRWLPFEPDTSIAPLLAQ
jgi:leucyl/phenylalanyl-tRNA--protein transferase